MIKLRVGQGAKSKSQSAGGNNVEAPVGDENNDQERNITREGEQDVQQKTKQQEQSDSTDIRSTAKGASGHRSGAPGGAASDKDRQDGMNFDEEAKERQTGEGGPANSGASRGGERSHAGR